LSSSKAVFHIPPFGLDAGIILTMKTINTLNVRETKELAQKIFRENKKELTQKCLIFALQGELGTGKTQFAKGLGRALGIKRIIVSPSFTLIREYPFKIGETEGIFYHIDAWRVEASEEWLALGIRELVKPGNVIAIEWPEKGREIWNKIFDRLSVKIIWVKLDHKRRGERKISWNSEK